MSQNPPSLQPGTLWPAVCAATGQALAAGALEPFETEQSVIDEAGVRFLVRRVSSLERKIADARRSRPQADVNPFLPYDPRMFVADIGAGHVALLNKYPVLEHHVLIVTRDYEPQRALLQPSDFAALWSAMLEYPALGFYNGGPEAGASQPHKHLQLVPLPFSPQGAAIPIETLLEPVPRSDEVIRVPSLAFRHAFCWLEPESLGAPGTAAPYLLDRYRRLLDALDIHAVEADGQVLQSMAYNLLVTRRWMLAVPRLRERIDSVFVNALGFAGSFFVRREAQMAELRRLGPMQVLAGVCDGPD
jgi:ATP adenylyltransferase